MDDQTTFDPKTEVISRIQFARQLFSADVNAMSHQQLATNCGGDSRCGYDFIYELCGFFQTFAQLLSDTPGDIQGPSGEWVRAPKDFQDKEGAMNSLGKAADHFEATLQNNKGNFTTDTFDSPVGPFTPLGMANLAVWHMMYHSGQLNYIQTVNGDTAFHWIPETQ